MATETLIHQATPLFGQMGTLPDPAEEARQHAALLREADLQAQEAADNRAADAWLATRNANDAAADAKAHRAASWRAADQAEAFADEQRANRLKHMARTMMGSADNRAKAQQLALTAHQRAANWDSAATEMRAVSVRSEPSPYSATSSNSYLADLVLAAMPSHYEGRSAALTRLERHGREVSLDAGDRRSNAYSALRTATRDDESQRHQSEQQFRAMTTGSGSAGAFASPAYLADDYALFRSYVPAVADACTQGDLPDYGMSVSVPADLGGLATSVQGTQNADIGESDFTAEYIVCPVLTYASYTEVSQALLDRSGPVAFDQVAYAQMRQSLDQQIDEAVITAMVSGSSTNLTRTVFSDMSSLWSDVNHAASTIEAAPGVVLPATHAFLPTASFRWLASQVDASKRPIWTADTGSQPNAATGDTGYSIASTKIFTDGSLPLTSGNATLLVASPASTLVLRGEPVMQVIDQGSGAGTLTALVRMYCYATVVIRYPSAAATASGAAYPAGGGTYT
jgi:HK97 family phage major capsid protein